MKKIRYIFYFIIFLFGSKLSAQEKPMDDLGNVSDEFQESYFEALKQRGIENYDKAIELLVNCNNLNPNDASVHFELGKNYYEIDQYTLAEKSLEKANSLKPNNQWILEEQYLLYFAQSKSDKVEEVLLKLVQLKPKYQDCLLYTSDAADD